MKRCILTATIFLALAVSAAAGSDTFCTLEVGTSRMLQAASIDLAELPDKGTLDAVQIAAQNIILGKMAEKPGEEIRLTWADVYRLRGIANNLICAQGTAAFYKVNCAAAALDAVGEGLTGSFAGQALTAVRLTGPVGFLINVGMNVYQENFQCNQNTVRTLARAGAEFALYLPVCKVGVVNRGCVAVNEGLEAGASKALTTLFGEGAFETVKALSATTVGQSTVKIMLKPVKGAIKDEIVNGVAATGSTFNSLLQSAGQQDAPVIPAEITVGLP